MINALSILAKLDAELDAAVELTLYGRAALQLGFKHPPPDVFLSRDVDAVFWVGQAEELMEKTNFWEAVSNVNQKMADHNLYISHFFAEDQVILTSEWRERKLRIPGNFMRLDLFRLSNEDMLLSKLMRDDPQDQRDACFIIQSAKWTKTDVLQILKRARIPDIPELEEQFQSASARLIDSL